MEFNLELGRDIVRYESVSTLSPYKHFLFSFLHSIFHKSSTDDLMKIKKNGKAIFPSSSEKCAVIRSEAGDVCSHISKFAGCKAFQI